MGSGNNKSGDGYDIQIFKVGFADTVAIQSDVEQQLKDMKISLEVAKLEASKNIDISGFINTVNQKLATSPVDVKINTLDLQKQVVNSISGSSLDLSGKLDSSVDFTTEIRETIKLVKTLTATIQQSATKWKQPTTALQFYTKQVKTLKKTYLDMYKAVQKDGAKSHLSNSELFNSRQQIINRLDELGASDSIKSEIMKSVEEEEVLIRKSQQVRDIQRQQVKYTREVADNYKEANKILEEYRSHSIALAKLSGKENTYEYAEIEARKKNALEKYSSIIYGTDNSIMHGTAFNYTDYVKLQETLREINKEAEDVATLQYAKNLDKLSDGAKEAEIALHKYANKIKNLKKLYLDTYRNFMHTTGDNSTSGYTNFQSNIGLSERQAIIDRLAKEGADQTMRAEIMRAIDEETELLRKSYELKKVQEDINAEAKQLSDNYREANKLLQLYKNNAEKLARLAGREDSTEFEAIASEKQKSFIAFEDFLTSAKLSDEDFDRLINSFIDIDDAAFTSELLQQAKNLDKIREEALRAESAITALDKAERQVKNLTIFDSDQAANPQKYEQFFNNVNKAKDLMLEMQQIESDPNGDQGRLQQLYKEYFRLSILVQDFALAKKEANAAVIGDNKEFDKLNKLGSTLSQYLNNYENKLKKLPNLYERLIELQRKLNNDEISAAAATRELNNIQIEARAAGVEVETLWDKLKKSFAGNLRGEIANMGWMLMSTSVRQVYQNVVQLDTAMTELKKVTNETEDAYVKFLDNAENRAKKLGATLVDTVTATADMARLGYAIEDASHLADVALIYKNVGDGIENIDDASATIISTMQGFGIEAENAMQIVDRFNEVANRYASSAGDIGAITKRSASAMQVAGATLDETIALGVTANEVVQDAEQVGNGLKTLSMRLRSTKSDMEAAGEDTSGMADSVSKLRTEILALTGVDLQIDEDTYKTPYQILTEIGKVWDELSDMERANVGEMLFGKQRANIGFAILENYERAEAILKTSQESAGSAFRENEIYLESIQGRLDKLAASWQSISNNLLDSDLVKTAVSGANVVLDIVNAIVENLGLMPGLIAAAGTAWAKSNNIGKECALLLKAA